MITRLLTLFLLISLFINVQKAQAQKYQYKAPQGWATEKIPFPFPFAPAIPYKGFEELRFAPGWADSTGNQRWAYTLLWIIEGNQSFSESTLKRDLESYYSGLSKQAMVEAKLDTIQWFQSQPQVKKIATATGDKATYSATVHFFDAHVLKKPSMLYGKIHVKNCPDPAWTYVIVEMAEVPTTSEVWKIMDKINADFTCTK
jgi:hypothetical protein